MGEVEERLQYEVKEKSCNRSDISKRTVLELKI
jgi:hypothetical protein